MSLARRIAEYFVIPADGRAAGAAGARARAGAKGADAPPAGVHATAASAAGRRRVGARRDRRADVHPADVRAVRARAVLPPRAPASLAVLAPARDAPALAASLALAVVRLCRSRVALVCVWAPVAVRPPWRVPALPAAARLAAALAVRGHDARGSGRLVFVRLAHECDAAAAEARRATAAAGPAPSVLALAGPRTAAFDALLAEQDLVVVAAAQAADPALTRLALAGLERGIGCDVPSTRSARCLAAAGIALLPAARRALAEPVAALA